jgi:hypothetical protein
MHLVTKVGTPKRFPLSLSLSRSSSRGMVKILVGLVSYGWSKVGSAGKFDNPREINNVEIFNVQAVTVNGKQVSS